MRYREISEAAGADKPLGHYRIVWGEKGRKAMGAVILKAASEKEARRLFKRDYIDARVFGWGEIRINWSHPCDEQGKEIAEAAETVGDPEDDLLAKEQAHWAEFYRELPGTRDNWAPYIVRRWVDENGRTVYGVFQQSHQVGSATLGIDGQYVTDLSVDPQHQRRGIATALYRHIEQDLGKPLKKSTYQTPDGDAFWKSRDGASAG